VNVLTAAGPVDVEEVTTPLEDEVGVVETELVGLVVVEVVVVCDAL
jgi:hypothetical protein